MLINSLDNILLTQDAYQEYLEFANKIANLLIKQNIKIDEISEENAIELPSGGLEINVFIRNSKMSFWVKRGEWKLIR